MFFEEKYLAGLLFALVACLALAGCGGGDETTALTKAEYVAKANAICVNEKKALEGEIEQYSEDRNLKYREPSAKVIEDVAEEVLLPSLERRIRKLKALAAPQGDEGEVAAIIAAAEKGLQAEPQLLISGKSFDKAEKLATQYGLHECFS